MARIKANGIEFEYDEMGPADGEPIVLVMGFTAQMTKWPEAFRKGLVAAGYQFLYPSFREGYSSLLRKSGIAPPQSL